MLCWGCYFETLGCQDKSYFIKAGKLQLKANYSEKYNNNILDLDIFLAQNNEHFQNNTAILTALQPNESKYTHTKNTTKCFNIN